MAWMYDHLRGLIRFEVSEHVGLLRYLVKWVVLGGVAGVLAGVASAVFLVVLALATTTREGNPWLLALLPVGGFVVGLVYHYRGAGSAAGNNLILDQVQGVSVSQTTPPRANRVPLRMAPLVLVGTVVTHLFGGSAGREGTGIQMASSLADGWARLLRLKASDRRILLIASIAGGFGSVFGVPLAGTVFALEVQRIGRLRYVALMPALTAAVIGDQVTQALLGATGLPHAPTPTIGLDGIAVDGFLLGVVAGAGLAFGLASILFSELLYGIRRLYVTVIGWPPARPLVGGVIVAALAMLLGGEDHLGLSLPLIERAYAGDVLLSAFLLKIIFTTLTVGAGFQGGEVTPLFVIGATLGGALAGLAGVPPELLAAVGLVAVFAGATNTPLACTIMGIELFGADAGVYLAVGCVVSYVFSGDRGIYESQRLTETSRDANGDEETDADAKLGQHMERRRPWLPNPVRRR